MAPSIGQRLGNYRLKRPLGKGGFAEVFLAEHIYLRTQVAIKILQIRLAQDEMVAFLHEARTLAYLEHPYIVRVLDFGVESNVPFLVMSYAPNGTLRQQHPQGTLLSPTQITPYVKHIASASQYAHDQRLIHRDIKPENLLMGPQGTVLLSDFGIAVLAQSSQHQVREKVVGTAAYI